LPYEIEKWDPTGTSTVWVQVPVIHGGSNNDFIYLYYNNPSAKAGQLPSSVWDGSYARGLPFFQR